MAVKKADPREEILGQERVMQQDMRRLRANYPENAAYIQCYVEDASGRSAAGSDRGPVLQRSVQTQMPAQALQKIIPLSVSKSKKSLKKTALGACGFVIKLLQ